MHHESEITEERCQLAAATFLFNSSKEWLGLIVLDVLGILMESTTYRAKLVPAQRNPCSQTNRESKMPLLTTTCSMVSQSRNGDLERLTFLRGIHIKHDEQERVIHFLAIRAMLVNTAKFKHLRRTNCNLTYSQQFQ